MPSSKKKKTPWIIAGGMLLLIVYGFMPRPVPVEVAAVTRGNLQVTVDEEGKTRIKQRYTVSAPLAGEMRRISLRPGDKVEAGKTLITVIAPNEAELLDPRRQAEAEARVKGAEAAVAQAEANVERLKAAHLYAGNDLDRAKQMVGSGAISKQEYESAEQREITSAKELRAAEFQMDVARFELKSAEAILLRSKSKEGLQEFEVYSPVSGQVLRQFEESAKIVTPGTSLVEVGDVKDLEVEIDVLSRDGVRTKPGAKVYLEHWGGKDVLTARVRVVEPAGFTKVSALGVEEQRVNIIADFVDPMEKWEKLGDAYRVETRIVVDEVASVLKIPSGALFRQGRDWALFAVRSGKAKLTRLNIGLNNGIEAQVLEGLAEGDKIILHPGDQVRDGVRVEY